MELDCLRFQGTSSIKRTRPPGGVTLCWWSTTPSCRQCPPLHRMGKTRNKLWLTCLVFSSTTPPHENGGKTSISPLRVGGISSGLGKVRGRLESNVFTGSTISLSVVDHFLGQEWIIEVDLGGSQEVDTYYSRVNIN